MTENEKLVASLVMEKFPDWKSGSYDVSFEPESDLWIGKLMSLIYSIDDESLPSAMGFILHSLLVYHPIFLESDEGYYALLTFLDAGLSKAELDEQYGVVAHLSNGVADSKIIQDTGSAIERTILERQMVFKKHLAGQASAIYEWLLIAEKWECSRRFSSEFESAKVFWRALTKTISARHRKCGC